ncbi:tetratricopeptide repeat protein [Brevibacillus sp. B_LB10_24]|uniref:tetratricopeptide repeat protein n=1 Tax=Brevibacillus sp. B_LB10_24 TaxID=3380645 RepID=UPI0038BAB88B
MSKFLLFSLLFWITGNPFIAIILLLVILYFLDMRFVGILPNWVKPLKQSRRLAKLKQEVRLNPHHTSSKLEIAHILIEKKRYQEALSYLENSQSVMSESAEFWYQLGLCRLKLGNLADGEKLIEKALAMNPRVKYGEPYLDLAEAFSASDREKALSFLERFREINSSSCKSYYLLGQLYAQLGKNSEAKAAFREAVDIYRSLPKYKKRTERRWAMLSMLK